MKQSFIFIRSAKNLNNEYANETLYFFLFEEKKIAQKTDFFAS